MIESYEHLLNHIKSNQIKLKVIYLAKQRLVAVDIGSRPLIQAQIIADIMDGHFWSHVSA